MFSALLLVVSDEVDVSTTLIPVLSFISLLRLGRSISVLGGRLASADHRAASGFARYALVISAVHRLIYPFLTCGSGAWLLVLLARWASSVIADSPQFSGISCH